MDGLVVMATLLIQYTRVYRTIFLVRFIIVWMDLLHLDENQIGCKALTSLLFLQAVSENFDRSVLDWYIQRLPVVLFS